MSLASENTFFFSKIVAVFGRTKTGNDVTADFIVWNASFSLSPKVQGRVELVYKLIREPSGEPIDISQQQILQPFWFIRHSLNSMPRNFIKLAICTILLVPGIHLFIGFGNSHLGLIIFHMRGQHVTDFRHSSFSPPPRKLVRTSFLSHAIFVSPDKPVLHSQPLAVLAADFPWGFLIC